MSVDCRSFLGFGIILEPDEIKKIKQKDIRFYESIEDDLLAVNDYQEDSDVFFGSENVTTSTWTTIKSVNLGQLSIKQLQQIGYISKLLEDDLAPQFYLISQWW